MRIHLLDGGDMKPASAGGSSFPDHESLRRLSSSPPRWFNPLISLSH